MLDIEYFIIKTINKNNSSAGFGADEPQRHQARVWRPGGEFEGHPQAPRYGIAGETAEFDDFRHDRLKPKRQNSTIF